MVHIIYLDAILYLIRLKPKWAITKHKKLYKYCHPISTFFKHSSTTSHISDFENSEFSSIFPFYQQQTRTQPITLPSLPRKQLKYSENASMQEAETSRKQGTNKELTN